MATGYSLPILGCNGSGDKMENKLIKRKQLRLRNFDYSTPGAYFITICTHNRKNTLSNIVGEIHESPETKLTGYGKIVDKIINDIPNRFGVGIDGYVIMPNHIHLIIVITNSDEARAIRESPLRGRSLISKIIGYIKMNASKEIRRQYATEPVWQRGFHDHIIRNREDYDMIAKYIYENPMRWKFDKLYSEE